MILLMWLLLSIALGLGAERRYGRNAGAWFLLAVVVSPLIAFAFLIASGPKKRAETAAVSPPPLPRNLPPNTGLEDVIDHIRKA